MHKIFIVNMCGDDNKGDLSIIENTVRILRRHLEVSAVSIQNADYSETDMVQLEKNKFSKTLADDYYGSFFPKVYAGIHKHKLISIFDLFRNFLVSINILIHAYISGHWQSLRTNLIPKNHRQALRAIFESDLVVVKGGSYIYSYGGPKQLLFIYRMLFSSQVALLLNKPVVFMGHSN